MKIIQPTNLIHATNVYNTFIDFKRYLFFLSPNEQIFEINKTITYLTKSNRKKISIKLRMSKELKLIKKQIIKPLN